MEEGENERGEGNKDVDLARGRHQSAKSLSMSRKMIDLTIAGGERTSTSKNKRAQAKVLGFSGEEHARRKRNEI